VSSRAPWWMYIVAASFLGLFALRIYVLSPLYSGPEPIGFRFDISSSTLTVLSVDPNGIGQRAGCERAITFWRLIASTSVGLSNGTWRK